MREGGDQHVYRELERLGAALFGTEDAVTTLSGSAAILALACCLGRPRTRVLLPGWICSGVFHALILAGLRPVPIDINADFTLSLQYADALYTPDTSLLVYAPFGGYAPDFDAWVAWANKRGIFILADLVQSPDPELWQRISSLIPAAITSFRPRKPLGASGGGLIVGRSSVIEAARTFLNTGRDQAGRKVSLGMELPLPLEAASAAQRRLALQAQLIANWRDLTRRTLVRSAATCFPGWTDSPYALSKIPQREGPGRQLNPDATYRSNGWKQAVFERFEELDETRLLTLDELYENVVITTVNPLLEREDKVR